MAKENVKAFFEALSQNEALQQALKAKELAYTGIKEDREAIVNEVLIPVAEEAGYNFTLEELKEFEKGMRPAGELDEDELESVSGGLSFAFGLTFLGGVGYSLSSDDCRGLGFGLCIVIGITGNPYAT